MANPVEIVINAQDNASSVFSGVENAGVEAGERITNSMNETSDSIEGISDSASSTDSNMTGIFNNWESLASKAGLAISGIGLAFDGLAQKQAGLTESTDNLARTTGMTSEEMRDLAKETSNVTFPLEDVTDLFELASQRGIRSAEAMQEYATYWDTVGDATGENATELAKAGVALEGIGIAAGEEEQALGAFGFIMDDTTNSVSEFLNFVDRTGPELRDMGVDIDDTAALLGAMEGELGMTGRTARQEFRTAVNESDGTMQGLLDTLGISEESLNGYREQVKGSSDAIQESADIHAESYTPLQKLKHGFDELTYGYGDQIQTLGNLSTVMMATGPLIQAMAYHQQLATVATKAWTVAQKAGTVAARGFAAAQAMALGPIGLVIAAIAAVIAIVVLAIKHWDKIKEVGIAAWEGIVSAAEKAWEMLKKGAEMAFKGMTMHWRLMYEGIKAGIEWIMDIGPKVWDGIKNAGKAAWDFIKSYWSGVGDFFSGLWDGVIEGFKAPINFMISGVNMLIDKINGMSIDVPDWVPGIGGENFGFNLPSIPRLHTGGIYNAPKGQSEGLALLKDGEKVTDPMTTRKQSQNNNNNNRPQVIRLELDGRVITEVVAETMQDEIILRGGE